MLNTLTRLFLASLFFAGSMVLPMGDFSLMQDLPVMYRNYTHLTTAEDSGVVDFIGDYLLGGRELFDHNKNDKHDTGAGGVNFQHQANPLPVLFIYALALKAPVKGLLRKRNILEIESIRSAYQADLFRPPIA